MDLITPQVQVLFGTLFGDGSLHYTGSSARFSMKHCDAQLEYLKWKVELLGLDIHKIKPISTEHKHHIQIQHRTFLAFWKAFYLNGNGHKHIPVKFLKCLTELSLAVWYFDDGNYSYWLRRVTLNTQGFTKRENNLLKNYFLKTWHLECKVYPQKIRGYKTYYFLAFSRESSHKLLELVYPYGLQVKCMHHKLGHLLKQNLSKIAEKQQKRRTYKRRKYHENINNERKKQNRRYHQRTESTIFKPHWSIKEIKLLRRNYLQKEDKEMELLLKHSKHGIRMKRVRLGLFKRTDCVERVKKELGIG